jgi:hypothetical protein
MSTMNPETLATSEPAAANGTTPPDPEVLERPRRRRFSAEYRLRILRRGHPFHKDVRQTGEPRDPHSRPTASSGIRHWTSAAAITRATCSQK